MTTLQKLIRPVLAFPDMLRVDGNASGPLTVFSVSVHGADYGRVCGKGGRNLRALEAIIEPIDPHWRLRLLEPSTHDKFQHVERSPEWDPRPVKEMLDCWAAEAGIPGGIIMEAEPRISGSGEAIYDFMFTEEAPPPDLLNALAQWASAAAQARGGKVYLAGAQYSTMP